MRIQNSFTLTTKHTNYTNITVNENKIKKKKTLRNNKT